MSSLVLSTESRKLQAATVGPDIEAVSGPFLPFDKLHAQPPPPLTTPRGACQCWRINRDRVQHLSYVFSTHN
ncbi:hypothetical protein J6590_006422 [Homalodisca vitripennis]|nr:hypothetical protein J6590_006422 [Homalodisca vitripennis]